VEQSKTAATIINLSCIIFNLAEYVARMTTNSSRNVARNNLTFA
jgi:hypothetical protein